MKLQDLRITINEESPIIPPPIQPGNIIPGMPDWWTGTLDQWIQYYQNVHPGSVPFELPSSFPSQKRPLSPLELPDLTQPGALEPGEGGPNMGQYNHRPWHWVDGEWVYDPHRPGGYTPGERRDVPMGPNGPEIPPRWNPKSPPTGPGQWIPGDGGPTWVPPSGTPSSPGNPSIPSVLNPITDPPNHPGYVPVPWSPINPETPSHGPIRSLPGTPPAPTRFPFPIPFFGPRGT